jgi:type 1 fimbria pilin
VALIAGVVGLVLVLGLGLGLGLAVAQAQSSASYEVKADGTTYQANFTAEYRSVKSLVVYFVSTGKVSSAAQVTVQAPVGARVRAQAGFIGVQEVAAALADPTLESVALRSAMNARKELPEVALAAYYEGDPMGNATVSFPIQKDSCASGAALARYLAKVTVDLSGVADSSYDQGFPVVLSVKDQVFSGAKVASIKPASDGLYKGEPILLMGTIGYGNEFVNIVQWRNGKKRSQRRIPVVKYVGYRGYGLSLARLKGVLNGGKATMELSDGTNIYGVCFSLARRRQVANGYPMEVR